MADIQHVLLGINGKRPQFPGLGTVRDLNKDPARTCRRSRHDPPSVAGAFDYWSSERKQARWAESSADGLGNGYYSTSLVHASRNPRRTSLQSIDEASRSPNTIVDLSCFLSGLSGGRGKVLRSPAMRSQAGAPCRGG